MVYVAVRHTLVGEVLPVFSDGYLVVCFAKSMLDLHTVIFTK